MGALVPDDIIRAAIENLSIKDQVSVCNTNVRVLNIYESFVFKDKNALNLSLVKVLKSIISFDFFTFSARRDTYDQYLSFLDYNIPSLAKKDKLTIKLVLQLNIEFLWDRNRLLRSVRNTSDQKLTPDTYILMTTMLKGYNEVRKTNYKFSTPSINMLKG